MLPPIISQKRRLIARPRPVPPYLRVVDASTCVKSWNSLPICSGGHADAGVADAEVDPLPVRRAWRRETSSATVPFSVNLPALLSRLNSTWRTLVMSACMYADFGGAVDRRACCRSSRRAAGCVVVTSSTISATSKVSRNSSILPASIFDRSRMSSISDCRCLPAAVNLLEVGESTPPGRVSRACSCSISL